MPFRLTAILAAALLALACSPAAAAAQHTLSDWSDGTVDDGYVDDVLDGLLPGPPQAPEPPVPAFPTTRLAVVKGKTAMLRTDGKAAVPHGAPRGVRDLIRAANQIVGRPYKWGGGHARLADKGYDCSGAVSYALIRMGLLRSPLVSGQLARAYERGAGRWVTIYANKRHVYMEVAGLRLDTSSYGDFRPRAGVRWRPAIGRRRGFDARHPLGW